jgi:hypothetical protein
MAAKRIKKTITIRLYSDDMEKLKYFAEGKDVTVSSVIRKIVRHTIEKDMLGKMCSWAECGTYKKGEYMGKYGTLQIRINLTKVGIKAISLAGPVSVHDQCRPGMPHTKKLTKAGLGHIIRRSRGEGDIVTQIKNALRAAGYSLK